MNIPMGGHGKTSLIGETISANGEHGHLYLYYQSQTATRNGGILIGLEGSEYNKYDQVGSKHTMSATSSKYSPTWGYKWFHKSHDKNSEFKSDLTCLGGPAKYNGMFMDLSNGWEYIDKLPWKDDMVLQTAEKVETGETVERIYRKHKPKPRQTPFVFEPVLYTTNQIKVV
jgi:hypothetical protein